MEHTITKFMSTCAAVGFAAWQACSEWHLVEPSRLHMGSTKPNPPTPHARRTHRDANVSAVAAVAGRHLQKLVALRLGP